MGLAAASANTNEMAGGLVIWAVIFAAYWTPTIVGLIRHIPNKTQVILVNLFLGWTFVGWVFALVWAVKPKPAEQAARTA